MRKLNENYYENLICFVTGESRIIKFSDRFEILYLIENVVHNKKLIADHIWLKSDTKLERSYMSFSATTYTYYSAINAVKKKGLKLMSVYQYENLKEG